MTSHEIQKTGSHELAMRLAVVDYSTIPAQAKEAELIITELKRRNSIFLKVAR